MKIRPLTTVTRGDRHGYDDYGHIRISDDWVKY